MSNSRIHLQAHTLPPSNWCSPDEFTSLPTTIPEPGSIVQQMMFWLLTARNKRASINLSVSHLHNPGWWVRTEKNILKRSWKTNTQRLDLFAQFCAQIWWSPSPPPNITFSWSIKIKRQHNFSSINLECVCVCFIVIIYGPIIYSTLHSFVVAGRKTNEWGMTDDEETKIDKS